MKMHKLMGILIASMSMSALGGNALAQSDYGSGEQRHPGMMQGQQGPGMMPPGGPMGPGPMGPGPMGGMGGMGPMPPMMLHHLGLSEEQWDKVRDIMHEQRMNNHERHGKMMDARFEMQKVMSKPDATAEEVGAAVEKMCKLRREMVENRIKTQNKIRDVLTKQQKQQFDAMNRGRMGMM